MGFEEVTNFSTEIATEVVSQIGKISLWLQTIGIISAFIIISIVINLIINKKRLKRICSLQRKMDKIEDKLDKVLIKKKQR